MQNYKNIGAVYGIMFAVAASTAVLSGCSKHKEDTTTQTQETDAQNSQAPVAEEHSHAMCNDNKTHQDLINVVKSNLAYFTNTSVQEYASSSNVNFDAQAVEKQIDNLLIEVKETSNAQNQSEAAIEACQVKLAITLPSEFLSNANKVYTTAEEQAFKDNLEKNDITFNNNMLIDDSFNFVINHNNGNSEVKVVGQPVIVKSAANLVATSEFKNKLDAQQQVRVQPRSSSNSTSSNNTSSQTARSSNLPRIDTGNGKQPEIDEILTTREPESSVVSDTNNEANSTSEADLIAENRAKENLSGQVLDEAAKTSQTQPAVVEAPKADNFELPENDDIEMVITQEEGTY